MYKNVFFTFNAVLRALVSYARLSIHLVSSNETFKYFISSSVLASRALSGKVKYCLLPYYRHEDVFELAFLIFINLKSGESALNQSLKFLMT